jgi:prevent-host-death family protein
MKPLQLQEAEQQFASVAEKASRGEPQIVSRNGEPFVVVVGIEDWRKKVEHRSVLEVLRSCPVDLSELIPPRSREMPRDISL